MLQATRKWLVLTAGVVMQACLGAVYAWSVYVPSLQADYGWTAGAAQLVFGLSIAIFTVSTLFAGRLFERIGYRLVALLGALLFAAGYLLAASGGGGFGRTLLGIGVVSGVGTGFGYLAVLSVAVCWFPRNKGLVTGIAVAGFGGGAILLAERVPRLLAAGNTVPDVFGMIGLGYGITTCICALLIFSPPSDGTVPRLVPAVNGWWPLRERVFWVLASGIFCGTFAGLLVVGNLKPIGISGGLSASLAASAIGFFAAGNAVGRLLWGWVYDRVGYRALPLSLLFLALTVSLLLAWRDSALHFWLASWLCGIGFGACFVLYAAHVAAFYGIPGLRRVFPLLFLFYGFSGITGPTFGGALFDMTGSYVIPVILSVAMLSAGAGLCWNEPVKGAGFRGGKRLEPCPTGGRLA